MIKQPATLKMKNLATNTIKKNVKPKYGDAAFLEVHSTNS